MSPCSCRSPGGRDRADVPIDRGPDRLGERHRPALRLAARLAEPVDERRARLRAGSRPRRPRPRRGSPRRRRRVATGGRSPVRAANHASPSGHVRTGPPAVTSMSSHEAAAPRARRVSHPPAPPRASSARSRAACSSSPARASSGVAAVVTTVQIGRPLAMRSPGCGTSRTPRSSQRALSPTTTSSVAKRTALPAAPQGGRSRTCRCASNTFTPYAASIASSDAVGRGLTSTVHARSPSQMKSTPNSPRRPNAAASREQIARAWPSGHPRVRGRDEVPAPAVAADAERAPPDELLGEPEHDGILPVADRRRRAREPVDALLHEVPAAQRAAAPLAHAVPPPPRSGLRSQRPEDREA